MQQNTYGIARHYVFSHFYVPSFHYVHLSSIISLILIKRYLRDTICIGLYNFPKQAALK